MPDPLLNKSCDVCHDEPAEGVAAVPGLPVSMAYGKNCLAANAHPYNLLVVNTAMCGGTLELMADWWKVMVTDTLRHLNIPQEKFDKDVRDEYAAMTEEQEKHRDIEQ